MRLEGVLATAVLLLGLCTPALGGDGGSDEGHLFAKGSDALSWDSDELTRIRNLHNANVFDDKEVFLAAENLATYLGLEKVNAVHMPMPLTFVFLGFTGDGNHKIDIDEEEVAAWFEGLDHILPHTRVELSELACSEDGYCTGMVHGRSSHTPVHSFVHLNFTCQVVIVTRLDVMSTFEHAIHTFSRPVDPQLETGAHQVDVNKMEAFVDNFVASIGLDSSYTILVLNPTWVPSEPVYGYRQGVSSQELDHFSELSIKIKEILTQPYPEEPQMPKAYSGTAWMERASTLNKFGRTDSSWHSERWVKAMEGYLREEQTYRNKMLRSLEDTVGGAAIVQAVRVLRALRGPIGEAIREEIIGDPFTLYANIYSRFQTLHPAEDCLVSNWVGRGRWLFIDLTSAAGGYEWGPAMGGDGVVHGHTLPTLDKYFDKLRSKKKALVEEEATSGAPGGKIKQEMQQYKNQHLASIANQRYQAYMMDRQRSEMASRAPGAKPLVADVENDMWNRIQREALVKAELDMLERYATHHCKDREDPPKICAELRDDVEKQRMNLARMSSSKGIEYDLFPQHKWDIFGAIDEVALDDEGVVDEATRSQDLFMADLSSVLSRAMRHVLAPPTAAWRHRAGLGQTHDTASQFYKQVNFDLYIIMEGSRARAQDDGTIGPLDFQIEEFEKQVKTLALGNQAFKFKVSTLDLMDDAALAVAFSMALRTTDINIPTSDRIMEQSELQYIDSQELSHHLRHHHAHRPCGPDNRDKHLQVPVYIFQVDRDHALLLDEQYSARALEDMIVVVHNTARHDEQPTGMMCGSAMVPRPLSPLKEALAAVLTQLGGILPPHLGYDPLRKEVTHDWLWSVGAHPMSFTSNGQEYSAIQRDALGRSYLLDALDSSIDIVNSGILKLRAARTTHRLHKHVVKSKARMKKLIHMYSELVGIWRNIVHASFTLDFESGTNMVYRLQVDSLAFSLLCDDVVQATEHMHCIGHTRDDQAPLVYPLLLGSAIVAAMATLYLALPIARSKQPLLNNFGR